MQTIYDVAKNIALIKARVPHLRINNLNHSRQSLSIGIDLVDANKPLHFISSLFSGVPLYDAPPSAPLFADSLAKSSGLCVAQFSNIIGVASIIPLWDAPGKCNVAMDIVALDSELLAKNFAVTTINVFLRKKFEIALSVIDELLAIRCDLFDRGATQSLFYELIGDKLSGISNPSDDDEPAFSVRQ